jgi:hypothetical protein
VLHGPIRPAPHIGSYILDERRDPPGEG